MKALNNACAIQSESCPVLSFEEELERVKAENGFYEAAEECGADDRKLLELMCRIICEVRRAPKDSKLQINRVMLSASEVSGVYRLIGSEELGQVLINFKKIVYPVKYIKAFLRSSLYNAVFEADARITNDVNVWNNGGAR